MDDKKYHELAKLLIAQMDNKQLKLGDKLPSIRTLAKDYQLSKNTVIRTLTELEQLSYIESKSRLGYFVSLQHAVKPQPQTLQQSVQAKEVSIPQVFYDIMRHSAAFDIYPKAAHQRPSVHAQHLQKALTKAAKSHSLERLSYYDAPAGYLSLRKQVSERYRLRSLAINSDEICITSGCQNSLFMALFSVCKPGDNVAVESPGFYGVIQLLEQLKLNIIEIPSSPEHGIDLDKLQQAATKLPISAVVVTPSFSTPTGALMPIENRKAIVSLANQFDFAVVEDDIYGELGFDGNLPPIKAFDSEQRVILCSSISKSLSRDLRIGWIAGGRWQDKIVQLKLSSQLASNQGQQQALAEFMANGHYKRHLDSFKRSLLVHRNQLISAIVQYFPHSVKYTLPEGGLALWLEFEPEVNTTELYLKAFKEHIIVTPGQLFSCSGHYKNCLRLSFNHPYIEERLDAIKQISTLLI